MLGRYLQDAEQELQGERWWVRTDSWTPMGCEKGPQHRGGCKGTSVAQGWGCPSGSVSWRHPRRCPPTVCLAPIAAGVVCAGR